MKRGRVNDDRTVPLIFFSNMTAFIRRSRLPAHLVRALSGGPGAPVPPSRGRVSSTLISYSVSGSRWPILCEVLSTGCRSYMVPETVRYSTSRLMMGPSPLMELALSWIQRYVAPTAMSWGGAMGTGGSERTNRTFNVNNSGITAKTSAV